MTVLIDPTHTAARRRGLLDALGGAAGLFVSGDRDFYYLTGLAEPEAALVLAGGRAIAFLRPNDAVAEGWDGRRLGVEAAAAALGVDEAYPIAELEARLPALLRDQPALCYRPGGALDRVVLPLLDDARGPAALLHPRGALHPLRMVKRAEEVVAMRAAADATAAGFAAARRAIRPGANEREVRAALEGGFIAHGASGPAFGTIVAGGANATVLHYRGNDAPLRDGDVVLLDAGAEVACYGCDVSRSYPVSGRFTPFQAAAYAVVLRAQAEALKALVPGRPVDAYHAVAERVLAEGLIGLGVLDAPLEQVLEQQLHKPYTRHRAGHFLGLETHDVGGFAGRTLVPGMILTIEPGLYFADRGLGIRIEDVALVGETGASWLTAAIPRELDEVQGANF